MECQRSALAAAAMIGMGTAHADTPDDVNDQALAAASSAIQDDPAVFDYSAAPRVTGTDASGDVFGTQDFGSAM